MTQSGFRPLSAQCIHLRISIGMWLFSVVHWMEDVAAMKMMTIETIRVEGNGTNRFQNIYSCVFVYMEIRLYLLLRDCIIHRHTQRINTKISTWTNCLSGKVKVFYSIQIHDPQLVEWEEKNWPTFNGLFRPANVNSFMTIWFKSCVFAYFPRLIRHRYGRTNARAIGHQPEIQSTWTRSHASSLFRLCSLPSKILRFYPTARAVFFGAWTFLLMLTKVLVDCVIAVQPLASATLWTSTVYVHYTVTIGNIFGSYDN